MVFGGEQAYSSARPEPVSRHQRPDRERDGDASCENDRQGGCSVYLGRGHAVSAVARGRQEKISCRSKKPEAARTTSP